MLRSSSTCTHRALTYIWNHTEIYWDHGTPVSYRTAIQTRMHFKYKIISSYIEYIPHITQIYYLWICYGYITDSIGFRWTIFNQSVFFICFRLRGWTKPMSQVPQCIKHTSHNGPLCNSNVQTCIQFCYRMLHCGISDWCIVGYVQRVNCRKSCHTINVSLRRFTYKL